MTPWVDPLPTPPVLNPANIVSGASFDPRVTAFGAFFDSSLDRAAEAAIYAGIVYSASVLGDTQMASAAVLALGIGSLVSYVRARGEGLGVSAHGGIAQRAEPAADGAHAASAD